MVLWYKQKGSKTYRTMPFHQWRESTCLYPPNPVHMVHVSRPGLSTDLTGGNTSTQMVSTL